MQELSKIVVKGDEIEYELYGELYRSSKRYFMQTMNDIELWQNIGGSNFTQKLIQLIAKADTENKSKLAKGFPVVVCCYLLWYYKVAFGKHFAGDEEFFNPLNGVYTYLR